MDLQQRVEAILSGAGVFPSTDPSQEITIEEERAGTVAIRRRPTTGPNIGMLLGETLSTYAEILVNAGLEVTEDPEDGHRPPSLRVRQRP